MTKGEVVTKISKMMLLTNIFGQTPNFQTGFRKRCHDLARAIAEEFGLSRVSDVHNLPQETPLGKRATVLFKELEQWFNAQARIED